MNSYSTPFNAFADKDKDQWTWTPTSATATSSAAADEDADEGDWGVFQDTTDGPYNKTDECMVLDEVREFQVDDFMLVLIPGREKNGDQMKLPAHGHAHKRPSKAQMKVMLLKMNADQLEKETLAGHSASPDGRPKREITQHSIWGNYWEDESVPSTEMADDRPLPAALASATGYKVPYICVRCDDTLPKSQLRICLDDDKLHLDWKGDLRLHCFDCYNESVAESGGTPEEIEKRQFKRQKTFQNNSNTRWRMRQHKSLEAYNKFSRRADYEKVLDHAQKRHPGESKKAYRNRLVLDIQRFAVAISRHLLKVNDENPDKYKACHNYNANITTTDITQHHNN